MTSGTSDHWWALGSSRGRLYPAIGQAGLPGLVLNGKSNDMQIHRCCPDSAAHLFGLNPETSVSMVIFGECYHTKAKSDHGRGT